MKFQFQISLTEDDYLEFNKFHMLRSPYGAKNIRNSRIAITVIFAFLAIASLLWNGFTLDFLFTAIFLAALFTVFQLLLKRFFISTIKASIKQLKKSGKMAFSPFSDIVFGESSFVETTDENKIEQKYSSIERISVVEGRYVYIHTNSIMGYILPISCFGSKEQYDSFLAFLNTLNTQMDFYKAA